MADTSSVVPAAADIQVAEAARQAAYIEYKADLVYGASDSGKTVQVKKAIQYVLEKYGQLSRVVTCDGGGVGPAKGLAASGQLEVWSIGAWNSPIMCINRAVKGWWPLRLDDPEAPLAPPDAGTWEIYGFYGFEGLTSIGDTVMMSLKSDHASLSQDPSYSFTQGGDTFSGGNKSYFGFVQDQLLAWVMLSHLLPVKKILWTALESRGDEDGIPIYGPAIAGRKSIGKATQWFGNSLHIDIVGKPPEEITGPNNVKLTVTGTERVMWLKTHADPMTKINFPAKIRVPDEYSAEVPVYVIPPDIRQVYELIDKMEARQAAESTSKMNQIEAVKERLMKAAKAANERAEKAAMEKRKRAQVTVAAAMPVVMPAGPVVVRQGVATTPALIQPAPVTPVAEPGHAPTIQTIRKPQAS